MRRILQVISWIALAATILPPVLFLAGKMSFDTTQTWMLAATIVWFIATPLWMGRKPDEAT